MKTANRVLRTFAAAFALLLTAQAAHAQQVCTMRDVAVAQLEKQFDEQVAGRGLAANGKLMLELFVSETGSWTVLVSEPDGRSCVLGSGEAWQGLARVVGDPI